MKTIKKAYSILTPIEGQGKTLGDLLAAIRNDYSLSYSEKEELIAILKQLTRSADTSTRIESLLRGSLGGLIGFLIGRYFGMGPIGQGLVTLAGYGIGKMLQEKLLKSRSSNPWYYV